MIEITFNGTIEQIPYQLLSELLLAKGLLDKTGIAVAVNHEVITRDHWAWCTLKSKDQILVIKATQGG